MTTAADSAAEFPPFSVLLSGLSQMESEQREYLREAVPEDRVPQDPEDHLVVAALRRSLDNIQGMVAMLDQRNVFCGMPIIRFQLDTAMCLFARTLVDDVFLLVQHMMHGKRIGDSEDRDGKPLRDHYLHKKLTEKHAHVSELYKDTSGYVHFSRQHLNRVLDLEHFKQTGDLLFNDIDYLTAGWSEDEAKGALISFMWATEAIIGECREWNASRSIRDS